MADDSVFCEQCERAIERAETTRRETMGGLDPSRWQTLCCPACGRRLKTVLVRE